MEENLRNAITEGYQLRAQSRKRFAEARVNEDRRQEEAYQGGVER